MEPLDPDRRAFRLVGGVLVSCVLVGMNLRESVSRRSRHTVWGMNIILHTTNGLSETKSFVVISQNFCRSSAPSKKCFPLSENTVPMYVSTIYFRYIIPSSLSPLFI